MQNIQITKVLRTKEAVKIEYTSDEDRNGTTETNSHNSVMKFVPHKDFIDAMNDLSAHMVELCEFTIKKDDETFTVDGISVSNKSKFSGVKILGHKTLSDGRIVGITAPFTVLDNETSTYKSIADLIDCVEGLQGEAVEYLEGKHALGGKQLGLMDEYAPEKRKAA